MRVERLRQFRAVAIERVGLQAEAPGEHVGVLAILDRRVVRHVDGLRDRAGDERLRRRHHADVALDREIALANAPAGVGAIEHREMLGLEIGRAFERHRAAGVRVGGLDLGLGEAERGQKIEARRVIALGRDLEHLGERLDAERPFVEDEADVESGAKRGLDLVDRLLRQTLGLERGMIDARRMGERRAADRISDDVGDLLLVIAERAQGLGHGAVDDLEIAAARELLELDQREVGLDAGRVAIHDEADRAGRRDDRDLRVAIAMRFAERQRVGPGGARGLAQLRPVRAGVGELVMVERGRRDGQRLVARRLAVGGALVIADHAQHRLRIRPVAGESRRSWRRSRPRSHRRGR